MGVRGFCTITKAINLEIKGIKKAKNAFDKMCHSFMVKILVKGAREAFSLGEQCCWSSRCRQCVLPTVQLRRTRWHHSGCPQSADISFTHNSSRLNSINSSAVIKVYHSFMCMGALPACISVHHKNAMPSEALRGCWIPLELELQRFSFF